MKTAILLAGNIRTWELCKSNFQETFKDLDYDVFLSTYDVMYSYHPVNVSRFGVEEATIDDYYIFEQFRDVNLKGYNINQLSECSSLPFNIHEKFKSLHPNTYWHVVQIYNCLEYMRNYEKTTKVHYDNIIKTRCDLQYRPTDFSYINGQLLIDSCNVYPNDCILMAERNVFIDIIGYMLDEFFTPIDPDSHLNPPHGLLLSAINYLNIEVDKRHIMDHVIRYGGQKQYY